MVGNPPFSSSLGTPAAQRSYDRYQEKHGALPDKQLAYLFLHESMGMIAKGGVLSLLQQYNFLYNQQSLGFRRRFIERWDVREILDFISVRGLFQKGGADTKVVVVVAEANQPPPERQILHATFRRSGRADAEQGFDIDYYDMHWLPRKLVLTNDGVWRSDLLGGGRVLGFVDRLKKLRTLGQFAEEQRMGLWGRFHRWTVKRIARPADHIDRQGLSAFGMLYFRSGIDRPLNFQGDRPSFKTAYTPRDDITPPMVLIREHMDLHRDVWLSSYLTYKNKIVGHLRSPQQCGANTSEIGQVAS